MEGFMGEKDEYGERISRREDEQRII
jgi:hypothetical protein